MSTSEPFLDLLTPEERAELRRRGRPRRWDRGEVLFTEGERSGWVLVLLDGRVKVSSHTASGAEVVLAIRGPGAILGELGALDGGPRSATVTALEPGSGIAVSDFAGFLGDHGRIAVSLLRLVVDRLRDADRKRIEFGAYDTTGRVATRLVELAERYGERVPEGVRVELPISQDELAGWTGSSREAVSKALRTLRSQGWVETGRRRVVIRDLDALRRRAR